MASIFETKCPECGCKFNFCKWDDGYQETGIVECPECGTRFYERSKFKVDKINGKDRKLDFIRKVISHFDSMTMLTSEEQALADEAEALCKS